MPGMGRTKYWWDRYHAERNRGASKEDAAVSASIAEKRHRLKRKYARKGKP